MDHVCDTPIVRTNEDDEVITFLYVKRVGTSLRHLGRHFGGQGVKLNVRWHGVAYRLWGLLIVAVNEVLLSRCGDVREDVP